jgi:hypothetical protein
MRNTRNIHREMYSLQRGVETRGGQEEGETRHERVTFNGGEMQLHDDRLEGTIRRLNKAFQPTEPDRTIRTERAETVDGGHLKSGYLERKWSRKRENFGRISLQGSSRCFSWDGSNPFTKYTSCSEAQTKGM